tara:strand:+ start:160 stop:495 length:336 start_codon:yes stop_codon:yes gene_type:complete
MSSRYKYRSSFINNHDIYDEHFKKRDVRFVDQYTTSNISYPSVEIIKDLSHHKHVWKVGDRYYKLAHEHYGDAEWWWVIAWYNKAPTEGHLRLGDVIKIPFPLNVLLKYVG